MLREKLTLPPPLRYMEKADEPELFALFEKVPMKLPGFKLIYDRSPDLQALLSCQAPHFETMVGKIDDLMLGLASLSWGERFVGKQKQTVAYLSDLRTVRDKRAAALWKGGFPRFIRGVSESGIDHILTAILADNAFAIRSLTQNPENEFRYHFLRKLTMVNVLGKKAFSSTSAYQVKSLPVSEITPDHPLLNFLDEAEKRKLFGYCLTDGEWSRRLKSWPDFASRRIYFVDSETGPLVACVPWSVNEVKRMVVRDLKWWMGLPLQLLRFMGSRPPRENEALDIAYLTHLHFAPETSRPERARLLQALFTEMKKEEWIRKASFLSFADSEDLHKEMKSLILQTSDVNLYLVTTRDGTIPGDFPGKEVSFEMALV